MLQRVRKVFNRGPKADRSSETKILRVPTEGTGATSQTSNPQEDPNVVASTAGQASTLTLSTIMATTSLPEALDHAADSNPADPQTVTASGLDHASIPTLAVDITAFSPETSDPTTVSTSGQIDTGGNSNPKAKAPETSLSLQGLELTGYYYTYLADVLVAVKEEPPNISNARVELTSAIDKFKDHYEDFCEKNSKIIRVEKEVHLAISKAATSEDVKNSAQLFGTEISSTMKVRESIRERSNKKWTGKFTRFLTKFYPIARFSLRLVSAISEVFKESY